VRGVSDSSGICDLCQAIIAVAASVIPPLGTEPGKRIFYCDGCDHYTFADWLGSFQQPKPGDGTPE
jgi:hypothetical protein